MSKFKEMLANDLDSVFLDLDAFGSEHEVNGVKIPIMFDDLELERIAKKNGFRDDVHQRDVFFYAKKSDLGNELHPGELMTLDGKDLFIQSARLDEGLWKIVLGRRQL